MAEQSVAFLSLALAALLVGTMFAVGQILRPDDLSAGEALLLMHRMIRVFNGLLPVLGLSTILATALSAWLVRNEPNQFWLLVGAAVGFMMAGLITRFFNQPINVRILTWSGDALPSDWTEIMATWRQWHFLRLIAGSAGYGLLVVAALM